VFSSVDIECLLIDSRKLHTYTVTDSELSATYRGTWLADGVIFFTKTNYIKPFIVQVAISVIQSHVGLINHMTALHLHINTGKNVESDLARGFAKQGIGIEW